MRSFNFPASVRIATDWVLQELVYADSSSSRRELPAWRGLGWFSKIELSQITPEEDPAIVDYCAPMGEVVNRTITFTMGDYPVVKVTVRGVRDRGSNHTSWSVSHVAYRLDIPQPETRHGGQWVEEDFLALTFHGAAGVSAPE